MVHYIWWIPPFHRPSTWYCDESTLKCMYLPQENTKEAIAQRPPRLATYQLTRAADVPSASAVAGGHRRRTDCVRPCPQTIIKRTGRRTDRARLGSWCAVAHLFNPGKNPNPGIIP